MFLGGVCRVHFPRRPSPRKEYSLPGDATDGSVLLGSPFPSFRCLFPRWESFAAQAFLALLLSASQKRYHRFGLEVPRRA